ncbi:hypothetical protein FS842_005761 [Serendipita sp. 407]|nr:hypothetical protein FS842_005761 [Serendipita sp. 407]
MRDPPPHKFPVSRSIVASSVVVQVIVGLPPGEAPLNCCAVYGLQRAGNIRILPERHMLPIPGTRSTVERQKGGEVGRSQWSGYQRFRLFCSALVLYE